MFYYVVDAFSEKIFGGNPAGVCVLDTWPEDELMQNIARENNLAETAFVVGEGGRYQLRWFTPAVEIELCGHATLATVQVLYELGYADPFQPILFESASGSLTAQRRGDQIELDFPQLFVTETERNPIVEKGFGIHAVYTGKNDNRYLIQVEDPEQVIALKPDFGMLQRADLGRFIITARSNRPEYDFISRYFAPGVGVPEDPVTGTAHCYLAPYWARKLGKKELVGFQASERSGTIGCELADNERIILRSSAVIMQELIPRWNK